MPNAKWICHNPYEPNKHIRRCSEYRKAKAHSRKLNLKNPTIYLDKIGKPSVKPNAKSKVKSIPTKVSFKDTIVIPKREYREWSPLMTRGDMYIEEHSDQYPKLLEKNVTDKLNEYIKQFNKNYACMFIQSQLQSPSPDEIINYITHASVFEKDGDARIRLIVSQSGHESSLIPPGMKQIDIEYDADSASITIMGDNKIKFEWSKTIFLDSWRKKINPNITRNRYLGAIVYQIYRHSSGSTIRGCMNLDRILPKICTKKFECDMNELRNGKNAVLTLLEETNEKLKRSIVVRPIVKQLQFEITEARTHLVEQEKKSVTKRKKARRARAENKEKCYLDSTTRDLFKEYLHAEHDARYIMGTGDWRYLDDLIDYATRSLPRNSDEYRRKWVKTKFEDYYDDHALRAYMNNEREDVRP